MKPYDFKWTIFFEANTDFQYKGLLDLAENELIICSTVIDKDNYSILTTRRLLTNIDGQISTGDIRGATDNQYRDFKSNKNSAFTFGQVQLQNGNELRYFIEKGKASMVMIYGVRTLIGTTQMTQKQVESVARIWNNKNEK